MDSNKEITWININNSVRERMVDGSLIHRFVPCKKVLRKTKILNLMLKKYAGLKSYSQYVKMKTAVLRNLSDCSASDDTDSFSDEDYSLLYKSDPSMRTYSKNSDESLLLSYEHTPTKTKKRRKCTRTNTKTIPTTKAKAPSKCIAKGSTRNAAGSAMHSSSGTSHDETDVPSTIVSKRLPSDMKRRLSLSTKNQRASKSKKQVTPEKELDLGWQQVLRRPIRTRCSSRNVNSEKEAEASCDTNKKAQCPREQTVEQDMHSILSNWGDHWLADINNDDKNNKEQTKANKSMQNATKNRKNAKSDRLKTTTNVTRSFSTSSTEQDSTDMTENIEVTVENNGYLDNMYDEESNQLHLSKLNPVDQSTPIQMEKSSYQMMMRKSSSSDTINQAQPKDSGIDEDSQESSRDCKSTMKKRTLKQNYDSQSPVNKVGSNLTETMNHKTVTLLPQQLESTSNNSVLLESTLIHNCTTLKRNSLPNDEEDNSSPDVSEDESTRTLHDTSLPPIRSDEVPASELQEVDKHKRTPKVMSTEIVSRRYKIIQEGYVKESERKDIYDKNSNSNLSNEDSDCPSEDKNYDEMQKESYNEHTLTEKNTEEVLVTNNICSEDAHFRHNERTEDEDNVDALVDVDYNTCSNVNYVQNGVDTADEEKNMSTDEEISLSTAKRVQQLKRLNLLVASDSDSENELVQVDRRMKSIDSRHATYAANKETKRSHNTKEECDSSTDDDCARNSGVSKSNLISANKCIAAFPNNVNRSIEKERSKRTTYNGHTGRTTSACDIKTDSDSDANDQTNNNVTTVKKKLISLKNDLAVRSDKTVKSRKEGQSKHATYSTSGGSTSRVKHIKNMQSNSKSNDNSDTETSEVRAELVPRIKKSATIKNGTHSSNDMLKRKNVQTTQENRNEHEDLNVSSSSSNIAPTQHNVPAKRPNNLLEFIDSEQLLEDERDPTFLSKYLSEDDEIYILNIPTTVDLSKLEGKRIVLEENKIKLGKRKYETACKETGVLSCILKTTKRRKPYKTVNIRPVGTILVQRQLPRRSATSVNVAESVSTTQTSQTPKKGRLQKQREDFKISAETPKNTGQKHFKRKYDNALYKNETQRKDVKRCKFFSDSE